MAAQPLPRTPDAVIYPKGIVRGDAEARIAKIGKALGPLLGCRQIETSSQLGFNLSTAPKVARPQDRALLFPTGHPRSGEGRYEWYPLGQNRDGTWWYDPDEPFASFFEAREGWAVGFLVYDPLTDADPAERARVDMLVALDVDRRIVARQQDPAHRREVLARMKDANLITEAEAATRLAALDAADPARAPIPTAEPPKPHVIEPSRPAGAGKPGSPPDHRA